MTSAVPAPALSATHYAQTTSWSTHNTHESRTEEEAEGQGGEVTGLKSTELDRDGAPIHTHHSCQSSISIFTLLKYS